MKATLFSSAAMVAMVAGAPTARTTGPTGTGVMYLNGEPMNLKTPTASHGLCSVDDDVLQCSRKIAANWALPNGANTTSSSLSWRGSCLYADGSGYLGCTVHLPYNAHFKNCKLQDPPVLTQLSPNGAFDCNSGGNCQYQMQFGTVITNVTSSGYKVGTQLSASQNVGIVSSSLQVSADFTQNWSDTQTKTTSETRTYNLNPGDICNPTTVQFRTACDTYIESSYDAAWLDLQGPYSDVVVLTLDPDDRQSGTAQPLHLCNQNKGDYAYVIDVEFEQKQAVCNALTIPGSVALDVGAVSGLAPWALQGCMFS